MSSLMSRVRDYIGSQAKPCGPTQISDAIHKKGDAKRATFARQVVSAIGVMYRAGVLVRPEGARGLYVLGRPVKAPMSKEEARKRRTERERARVRKRGVRSREEYLALLRERSEALRIQRETEREERRLKERQARARAVVKTATARKAPKNIVIQPKAPSVIQVAPPKPRFETSDEWMARTGGKPEVLPPPMAVKPWEPLPTHRKKAA